MEFAQKPMRSIEIRPTANGGFLVQVGCAQFAYTDELKLVADLSEYLSNPVAVEKEYNQHHKAYDEVAPEQPRSLGEMERVVVPQAEGQSSG